MQKITYLGMAKMAALEGLRTALSSGTGVLKSKGHDITTSADENSSNVVNNTLQSLANGVPILSEETKTLFDPSAAEMYWIVDPIDGSNNRSRQFPYWSVSVSLVENGIVVAAVVATKLYGKTTLFSATKGTGMYRNSTRVYVGNSQNLLSATVAFDNSYNAEQTQQVVRLLQKLEPMPWLKNFGSAVLTTAEVAAGVWDAHYHWAFKPWDIAAGLLFIEEAGGIFVDLETGNSATLKTTKGVCGNKYMVQLLLDQLGLVK